MFHWSLYEIDQTDMESMIGWFTYYPGWKERQNKRKKETTAAENVQWF